MTNLTVLVFWLVLVVGGVLLQIFLSKREAKWPGLILPGITFLYSLLMALNVAAFGTMAETAGPILAAVLLGNIPTVVLLAIYAACREKRRKKKDMDKMNVQDL